jgi:RNA polymerase sigma factor (TIGR02999 family)
MPVWSITRTGKESGMAKVKRTVSRLLRDWQAGDRSALDELWPLIHGELHRRAARYLHRERAGHTLRPTELLSELYLRLVEQEPPASNDRIHFLAIAGRIMRQILVDSARHRCASKRGGGQRPVTFDEAIAAADRPELLVELDDALIELARHDERAARVIELSYYCGLTQDEIALFLDVHINTVARDLRFGLAWIQTYLDARGA